MAGCAPVSGMAALAAEMLTDGPQDDDKLVDLLIMLNSASSSNAACAVRDSIETRFHKPVAALLDSAVLALNYGVKYGLVGRNGVGKTSTITEA